MFDYFKSSSIKDINNKMPVIQPTNNTIKEKPEELELFPHSDSSIWNAFQKNTNEKKTDEQELDYETKKTDEKNKKISGIKEELKEKNKDELLSFNKNITNDKNEENINNIRKETENSFKETKKKENVEKKTSKTENTYFLQLASVSDIKLVPVEWKRLLRIYPALANKKYEIKKINLKNGDTYYRILLGNFESKKDSQEFCKNVIKKSNCIIRTYE
tara:strand:- start:463 stop:1113 length:651 start_codon:yes stop_codon:yes gene_type:complete